jgi:hypothetical protein
MTGVTRSPRNIAHRIIEEFMLAANEAVAAHLEQTGHPAIYRVHEQPDPKRVMEFEEIAAQFGYSLGVGAIPVSRHRYKERKAEGRKVYKDVDAAQRDQDFVEGLSEAGGEDRRQAGRAHPELSDAAVAEAGALQRGKYRPFCAGGDALHALHFAHPALSGSDRAPAADGVARGGDLFE